MADQVPCQGCNGSGQKDVVMWDGEKQVIIPTACGSCGGTGRA